MEEVTISILGMPALFAVMLPLERRLVLLLLAEQVVCGVKLQLLLPRQTRLKLVLVFSMKESFHPSFLQWILMEAFPTRIFAREALLEQGFTSFEIELQILIYPSEVIVIVLDCCLL
jgi:hypothetical protein